MPGPNRGPDRSAGGAVMSPPADLATGDETIPLARAWNCTA